MKKVLWNLKVLHPLNQSVIQVEHFNTLKEISEKHKTIPFNTWRNIAIGRSKVYNNFIQLDKQIKDDTPQIGRDSLLYNPTEENIL